MNDFGDIKMLQDAGEVTDGVWDLVKGWDHFAQDTVGKQLVRATDSIGANIAEAFGRFHYGEKINFMYYARGSVFECKYWLNRALKRQLITAEAHYEYTENLTEIAKQINGLARNLKSHRYSKKDRSSIRESDAIYTIDGGANENHIFSDNQLEQILGDADTDKQVNITPQNDFHSTPNP